MTPLDFQERNISQELQELIKIHRLKTFSCTEPDPWTWQVWTKIQREKNTLKQLISVAHPHLHAHHSHNQGTCHGDEYHSHAAGHTTTSGGHQNSHNAGSTNDPNECQHTNLTSNDTNNTEENSQLLNCILI